jgi:hypothetical protein
MKRKRRIEITRFSRRTVVVHGDASADFAAAEQVVADIARRSSVEAPSRRKRL